MSISKGLRFSRLINNRNEAKLESALAELAYIESKLVDFGLAFAILKAMSSHDLICLPFMARIVSPFWRFASLAGEFSCGTSMLGASIFIPIEPTIM